MTTAVGPISLARDALRNTMADSPAFRAWVNATGASAQQQARRRIHDDHIPTKRDGAPYTLNEYRAMCPYVLIATAGFTLSHDGTGGAWSYADSGELDVRFVWQVPGAIALDDGEIARQFGNDVGQILVEMVDLSGTDGYLLIQNIQSDGPMGRTASHEIKTLGDAMVWDWSLRWGVS